MAQAAVQQKRSPKAMTSKELLDEIFRGYDELDRILGRPHPQ